MKIALVLCPPWTERTPPITPGYLKAYLEQNNHEAKALDFNIEVYHQSNKSEKYLWMRDINSNWIKSKSKEIEKQVSAWVRKIEETKANAVGFTVYKDSRELCLETARQIKKRNPEKIIIFGGPDCNLKFGLDYLKKQDVIDIIVTGEGEETLLEILDKIERKERPGAIKGALVRKEDRFIESEKRSVIKDIDSIPLPDLSDFPLDQYSKRNEVGILGSRGCIGVCEFCQDHVFTRPYRSRSALNIFKEINIRFKQGYSEFFFNDLVMNGDLKQLEQLCDLIINSSLQRKIKFTGQFRFRKMEKILFEKLKKAGCDRLLFGLESGSQKILDVMKKGYDIKEVEKNLKDMFDAGIETSVCLLVGFPGENEETIKETMDFLRRNKKYIPIIGALYQFELRPGCPAEQEHKKYNIIRNKDNFWETSDGKNNFEWRMEQIRKILELAYELGIKIRFDEIHFYHYQIFHYYYFYKKDYDTAFKTVMKSFESLSNRLKSFKETLEEKDSMIKHLRQKQGR